MDLFTKVARALSDSAVRFVIIGVSGANYYAREAATLFTTLDRDLFLPAEPENERKAWHVCKEHGLALWCGGEPLAPPLDAFAAERVVERRLLVQATDRKGLDVDLTLVMAGFDFETVWRARRTFGVDGVEMPVARLSHIIASKAATGREKDRLFLSVHAEALRQLVLRDDDERSP